MIADASSCDTERMRAAAITCTCLVGCGRIGFGAGGTDGSIDAVDAVDAVCPTHWGTPVQLPSPSSGSLEYGPGLSGDGLELYFESSRSGGNDIWVSTRATLADTFGDPKMSGVSSVSEDIAPFVSADGRTLYFASNRSGADRLYYATRAGSSGEFGVPLLVPGLEVKAVRGATISSGGDEIFYATSPTSGITRAVLVQGGFQIDRQLTELGMTARFPSLSADGLTLYFGATGPSSSDLFTATRPAIGVVFTGPMLFELSDAIAFDGDPDISKDGQTLVFASERPGGEGSGDLWISQRVCD
jgi:Tol biopolymer transport system component